MHVDRGDHKDHRTEPWDGICPCIRHIASTAGTESHVTSEKTAAQEPSAQPIENHGIIGDLNTVALVGRDGSIDFMCFPRFDSPTIFAALLDRERGGQFLLAPESPGDHRKQLYLPDSNILLTRFLFDEGVGEVSDFMAVDTGGRALVRRAKTVRGEMLFRMLCAPRFDYARAPHRVDQLSANEVLFVSEGADRVTLLLRADVPLSVVNGDAVAEVRLGAGQSTSFVLEEARPAKTPSLPGSDR